MVDMTPTALKKLDRELNQFLDEMITGMGLCISHQDAFSSSAPVASICEASMKPTSAASR